jgi:hypothetical protein
MDKMHTEYGELKFDNNTCFLCGCSDEDMTPEHLFPKWLQNKYNLWDQQITLLNGTNLPYRNMTVPCCKSCNNTHLAKLESEIRFTVESGYDASNKLDSFSWYLWAGKVLYGILRKEISLLADRADPSKGNIISEEVIKSFSNLHMFLQGIRNKHIFVDEVPYTVLICNLHDCGDQYNYDFKDDLVNFTLSLRMGEVGVIVSFQDAGLIRDTFARYVDEVDARKLHPLQFDELYAKINYQVSLMEYTPSFLTSSDINGEKVAETRIIKNSGYVKEWSQEYFSKVLYFHVAKWLDKDTKPDDLFVPPNLLQTWMTTPENKLLLLEKENW